MTDVPDNTSGNKDLDVCAKSTRDMDKQVDAVLEQLNDGKAIDVETREKVEVDADAGVIRREEVFLRIYDLSQGTAKVLSERLLGFKVDGVWHTSIEIYGNEYYFQNGLVYQLAGTTYYGRIVERISLGFTDCTKEALEEFFEMSKHTWTPESYDLFENNCNNFSNYLSNFLVEKGIPSHILELPEMVKTSPMFQKFFSSQK